MKITDIHNHQVETDCLGCAIASGEYSPPGGVIYSSKHFSINQDCEIPIIGFIIISTNRHIQSIDEFTNEEKAEYIGLLASTRKALREVLDVQSIFVIQVENQEHHFHTCLLPITEDMRERFGTGFSAVKPYMEYARKNLIIKKNLKQIDNSICKMRDYLRDRKQL